MSTDPQDRSIAELTRQLSDQATRLAQQEVELAKAELSAKGKKLGIGAGAFGGAALVGVLALGALVATAILLLATAMTAWLAALIVTVVLGAIAGVLALMGKSKVEEATPPVPQQTIDTVKADVQEAKTRAQEGRA
jgi:F0F1-type ATP synthase assembly protein I